MVLVLITDKQRGVVLNNWKRTSGKDFWNLSLKLPNQDTINTAMLKHHVIKEYRWRTAGAGLVKKERRNAMRYVKQPSNELGTCIVHYSKMCVSETAPFCNLRSKKDLSSVLLFHAYFCVKRYRKSRLWPEKNFLNQFEVDWKLIQSLRWEVYTPVALPRRATRGFFSWSPIQLMGSLSKHDVNGSENVIWTCNFAFLQLFFNYSKSLCLKNVF